MVFYSTVLTIGPFSLTSNVLLAPMAGVSDLPFRQLCQHYGAGLTTSEMLTSDSRLWHSNKSQQRLTQDQHSKLPNSMQIVGYDADMLADAATKAVNHGAELIDINMGCPAKKVCKKAAGSALLKDETLVGEILDKVVAACELKNVPVTLKIRTGWDKQNRNAVRIGKIAANSGIQALSIHGRTRACKFSGHAEFDCIAEVKSQINIPVVANGDINSPEKALAVLKYTGADGIMIGRAAQGKPWLFQQINQALANEKITEPDYAEKCHNIYTHVKALHTFYGDYLGVRISRKHTGWYFENMGLASFKKTFNGLATTSDQLLFIKQLSVCH